MSSLTVVKANQLVEASYKLTLGEQRLILNYIAQIDSVGTLKKQDEFVIHVKDYAEQFNIDRKNAYSQVREIANTLYERSVILKSINNGNYIKTRWISSIEYSESEGRITVGFAPKIIPYLSNLKKNFTQYKLEHITKMSSVYAIRTYELLVQWGSKGKRTIEIEAFRACLGIPDSDYPRMFDFKKRVLDVAIDQINRHSNLKVDIDQKKTGRKVSHLLFSFTYKEHLQRKVSAQKQQKTISGLMKILEENSQSSPLH
jgi:plasmid replication initiation protein